MTKAALAWLTALLVAAAPAAAEDARTVVAASAKAIGAESVTSVTYHGSGSAYAGTTPDTRASLAEYRRTVDFAQSASSTRSSTSLVPLAGADQVWLRQVDVYLTPWGFLKGAAANAATVRTKTIGGTKTHVVSFTVSVAGGASHQVVGYIDARTNLPSGIETWVDSQAGPPTHVQALFGKWQDGAGGLRFPAMVVEQRNGKRTLEVQVAAAEANPANLQSLMAPSPQPAG